MPSGYADEGAGLADHAADPGVLIITKDKRIEVLERSRPFPAAPGARPVAGGLPGVDRRFINPIDFQFTEPTSQEPSVPVR